MIYYYDLKSEKTLFCCANGELIYRAENGQPIGTVVAYRDINDPDYAWYKDIDSFDDPVAYEKSGIVYNFESKEPMFIIGR